MQQSKANGVRHLRALCYCACFSAIYFLIFSMSARVGSIKSSTSSLFDVLLIHVDNAVVVALVTQLLQAGIDFVFLHREDAGLDVMEVE